MGKDLGISIEEKVHRIKAYLDETLTPEEEAEFRRWLSASVANRVLLDRIRDERILLNKIRFSLKNNKGKGWGNIQKKIRKRPNVFVRFMRYAAVLVAIVLVSVTVYQVVDYPKEDDDKLFVQEYPMPVKGGYKAYLELTTGERLVLDTLNKVIARVEGAMIKTENAGTVIIDGQKTDSVMEKSEYNRLVIPRGGEYKIVLADGSQVWINSQSVLEFPAYFVKGERRVRLKGEAYFEVAKNQSKPFIVQCRDYAVKVLGTSFNVNSYEDDKTSKTTLATGKVEINMGGKLTTLKPGHQAIIKDGKVSVEEVDVEVYTTWMYENFRFKSESVQEIMTKLSRWYAVDVFYMNESVKNYHFTGYLPRYAKITDVLELLSLTTNIKFDVKGRTVTVMEKL